MRFNFAQFRCSRRNDLHQQTKAPSRGTKALEPSSTRLRLGEGGFSLVEVTVALGIVAFAFTAVVGLLPVGMRAAEDGRSQGGAMEVLNTAAAAVFGQRSLPASEQFAFGDWLNDSPNPQDSPRGYAPGDQPWEEPNFKIMESGVIRPVADATSPVRYSMYMEVTPPATSGEPVKVYLSVAWPGTAEWNSSNKEWTKHQGHVETLLYANPPISL